MPELSEERCASCGVGVPPTEAHEVRTALEHATESQRIQFTALFSQVPALLDARCFNAALSTVNHAIHGTQRDQFSQGS